MTLRNKAKIRFLIIIPSRVCGLKDTVDSGDYNIQELRKSFDKLTNAVIIQLNKINRILIDIEKEKHK